MLVDSGDVCKYKIEEKNGLDVTYIGDIIDIRNS